MFAMSASTAVTGAAAGHPKKLEVCFSIKRGKNILDYKKMK